MSLKNSTWARLLSAVLAAAVAVVPVSALAQRAGQGANNPVRNIPVTGTTADGQSFTGTLDLERFEAVGDQLLAVGQVSGKFSGGTPVNHAAVAIPVQSVNGTPLTAGFGGTTGSVERRSAVAPAVWDPARSPTIIQVQASCNILTLDLGPLHLDLLGLVVDLNAIHLQITAQQGSGNLLGNLLCAVANLLNGGGALAQLSGLLSQITNILNGIVAGL
jgi:hypothetical protein